MYLSKIGEDENETYFSDKGDDDGGSAADDGSARTAETGGAGGRWEAGRCDAADPRGRDVPELVFNGTLPTFNNNYNAYQNPDGSYGYVRSNWLGLSGELSVTQNIPFTGGTVSLSTGLDLTRQLGSNGYNEFMAAPIALTFNQPLFSVNTFRWDKKIEPVRYAESRAAYDENMEAVKMNTISYFFNYILATENLKIAGQNLENADRLYEVAKARREIGQISETELMQLRLSALQAKANVTSCRSNLNSTMFTLRAFLGLSEQDTIVAVLPEAVPLPALRYEDVLDKALANSSFAQNIQRRKLEADYEVAIAKGQRYQVDLNVTVGYSGVNRELAIAYNESRDQEVVSVGLSIPILDWGKRKGQVRMAESNRDVVHSQLQQEELNFAVQQPGRPAGPRPGVRPCRLGPLPGLHRVLPHRTHECPGTQRCPRCQGSGPPGLYPAALLLLVLLLRDPLRHPLGFCHRHSRPLRHRCYPR